MLRTFDKNASCVHAARCAQPPYRVVKHGEWMAKRSIGYQLQLGMVEYACTRIAIARSTRRAPSTLPRAPHHSQLESPEPLNCRSHGLQAAVVTHSLNFAESARVFHLRSLRRVAALSAFCISSLLYTAIERLGTHKRLLTPRLSHPLRLTRRSRPKPHRQFLKQVPRHILLDLTPVQ